MPENESYIVRGYRENPSLWRGFDKLAMGVFRLNLAPWREAGYGADFIPYSVVEDGEVVANVAFNRMRLLIGGRPRSAFQLSTVMTRPDFRGQGLSALLIRHILEEHAADCDFFYLFANGTVLDFYPRFGFRRVPETRPFTGLLALPSDRGPVRRLDLDQDGDMAIFKRLIGCRVPVSPALSTIEDEALLYFRCTALCREQLYYLPDDDLIAVADAKPGSVELKDVISPRSFDLERVMARLAGGERALFRFGFIPAPSSEYSVCYEPVSHDALFVLGAPDLGERVLFPVLSHA